MLCIRWGNQSTVRASQTPSKGAGDAAFLATVVLDEWADVPSVDAVGCHVLALSRCDMDDDAGTWWGKGALVEIECAD